MNQLSYEVENKKLEKLVKIKFNQKRYQRNFKFVKNFNYK